MAIAIAKQQPVVNSETVEDDEKNTSIVNALIILKSIFMCR